MFFMICELLIVFRDVRRETWLSKNVVMRDVDAKSRWGKASQKKERIIAATIVHQRLPDLVSANADIHIVSTRNPKS